jgi:hypothetical protein
LIALKINYQTEHFRKNWNHSKFQLNEARKIIAFFFFNFILSEEIDDKNGMHFKSFPLYLNDVFTARF